MPPVPVGATFPKKTIFWSTKGVEANFEALFDEEGEYYKAIAKRVLTTIRELVRKA